MRHLMLGDDCAIAGAAMAVLAAPIPATFKNCRRFIPHPPDWILAAAIRDLFLPPFALEAKAATPSLYRFPPLWKVGRLWTMKIKRGRLNRPLIMQIVRLTARTRPNLEGVERIFGDLPPQIFVVAEGLHRIQHLLVERVGRRGL